MNEPVSFGSAGYRACACFECFEIAIGEAGALCLQCEEAACDPDESASCHVEALCEEEA